MTADITTLRSNTGSAPQPPAPAPEHVGLKELLGFARRRIWLIGGVTTVLTVLAAVILFSVEPRYTATALIMVDNRATSVASLDSVVSGLPRDAETVASEIEILRSRRLANEAIDALQLDADPEFNHALRPPGLFTRWRGSDKSPAARPTTPAPSRTIQPDEQPLIEGQRVEIIDAFIKRLRVEPRSESQVISVSFSSIDPRTAALVVNSLADQYILDQLESKYEAIRHATDWLNTRVQELRERVEVSENAVEKYRSESGLLEGQGVTLGDQQFTDLSTQLILAQSELSEARARQRQIQQMLASPGGVESAGEVLGSALIQRLREQQAEIQGQVAELSAEYGNRHPRMIKLRAEAADLNSKIATEIDKIVKALDYEVSIARARVGSLQNSLNDVEGLVAQANTSNVKLRALEREAQANRMLLETMLTQFMQTSSQNDITSQQPDARIISRADVPNDPSFPATLPILAIVFIGSLFLGLMFAFAGETLDKGIRGSEQAEELTGLPSLGILPRVRELSKNERSVVEYLREHRNSAFAESIRTLQSMIAVANGQSMPQIILITSSQSGEGKTTVAASLATMLALDGRSVAIIDADMHRPALHRAFGVNEDPGLAEVLTHKVSLGDLIHADRVDGEPTIIPAGKAFGLSAPGLLASADMSNNLEQLEKEFDHIIIDSPPIMAVSDALILTARAESTVFVAKWGETSGSAVRFGLKRLSKAGGRPTGLVLSMVDVRQYAHYNYGDSGSYVGRLSRYYAA